MTEFSSLLAEHSLGQSEFSRLSGIPLRTVQDWAGGRRTPPDWQIMLIRCFLDSLKAD